MGKARTVFFFATVLLLGCGATFVFTSAFAEGEPTGEDEAVPALVLNHPEIIGQIDVAPVWSVHQTGRPVLVTRDEFQYLCYYDSDRHMTVAQRRIGTVEWSYHRFPVQTGWQSGGHAKLTLAVDRDGYIHVSAYRRRLLKEPSRPPLSIYYRSEQPHDIGQFERVSMVSPREHPHYPTFFIGPRGALCFQYRDGGSGNARHVYNVYDEDERKWSRLIDRPLFDGRRGGRPRMSAYPSQPRPGPDDRWHIVWVWRTHPADSDASAGNASNHSLSYVRSPDMQRWETVDGTPVDLPITGRTEGVVADPAGTGSGLSNMTSSGMGWDSHHRTVLTYHKFDDQGHSQFFNARFEDGRWRRVQATDWDFRWPYEGGTVPMMVRGGGVSPAAEHTLEQVVWSQWRGRERIVLDERTLEPLRREAAEWPEWRTALLHPESDFQVPANRRLRRRGGPMEVSLISDQGETTEPGVRYLVRWEHAGSNIDGEVPKTWPESTMLRVYKIADPE